MRIHRMREQWRTLFDEQQRSGLNKTQFCRQHGITRSAFSNARHRLFPSNLPASAFVSARPPCSSPNTPLPTDILSVNAPTRGRAVTPAPLAEPQLILSLPGATLSLPVDIAPRWLATLEWERNHVFYYNI